MERILYLLRHGELVEQDVLAGHSNISLSEQGLVQLTNAVQALQNIEQVISSPLQRCSSFAKQYAQQINAPLVISDLVKEMNFGDWDGQPYQTLWQQQEPYGVGDFWQNPWQFPPINGENMTQFSARIDAWWQNFLKHEHAKHTLLLTHAGVIKHILARVTGINMQQVQYHNVFSILHAGLIKVSIYTDEHGQHWPKLCF